MALASILAMVYMSIQVTRNQAGFGGYITYQTTLEDASGIFPKTAIKVAGINAGKIKSIRLHQNKALIEFEVIDEVIITKDAVLRIKSVGLLGDKFIDIKLGKDEARLAQGSQIPSEVSGGLESLATDAGEAIKDLKVVLKNIRENLSPSGQESPIKKMVANLDASFANLKTITQDVKEFVQQNKVKLNTTVDNFEEFSGSLANEFDRQNQESLINKAHKIGGVLDDARSASKDLKVVMSDVRAGKGTVGKLLRDEQVVDQVSQTLSGVNRMVNRFNSIRSELELFTNISTEQNNRSEIDVSIYPSPERFYRLGLVSTELGVETESEITEEQNGVKTTTTRKEVNKNSFRFNAQIGREIQNWRIRVGLIESTGGLGLDYLWRNANTMLTLEAFDYRKRLGPNIRFYTQVHFWNVLYLNLGGEDLLSKEDEEGLFYGAGLRFTDEDLRSLISLVF